MPIQFLDIKDLTSDEADIITDISSHYHDKLKIKFKNFLLKVHVKKQKKIGKTKYSTHLNLESPDTLAVSNAHDWDLARVLHESFKKLESELNHKFKLEGHLPKPK